VEILGISAHGYHGVLESERAVGQPFLVDVRLWCDTTRAIQSDDLADAVDYGHIARTVAAIVSGEPVCLLETLAHRILDAVFGPPQVTAVDIAVHKPSAPVGVPVRDVVARVRRTRGAPGQGAAGVSAAGASEGGPAPAAVPSGAGAVAPPSSVANLAALREAGVPLTRRAIAEAEAQVRVVALEAQHAAAPGALAVRETGLVDLDSPPRWPADVILSLGGNVGDALGALRGAVDDLSSVPGIDILGVSPLARTKPVGIEGQQDFFNAVVAVRTSLAPRALLHTVQGIEAQHGRTHEERWGPRPLDIDIVAFDTLIACDEELMLPHPRAYERAFVLLPWATLSPDAFLPGLNGGMVARLAEEAPDRSGVRWLALDWLTVPVALSGALPKPPFQDPPPMAWG